MAFSLCRVVSSPYVALFTWLLLLGCHAVEGLVGHGFDFRLGMLTLIRPRGLWFHNPKPLKPQI